MAFNAPDDPTSSSLFDWSDFLDFNLDDNLNISFPQGQPEPGSAGVDPAPPQSQDVPVRVRKRDPRLVCSNFLAGRIPCACPELDEKLEEEEAGGALPGKKRPRMAGGAAAARCQVPGCEADISELKGYHKRHRVCLLCANATTVVLDGESKRYCQQCGKFHILSDFDEGKRSCRRKLERHNNRRRRKPNDSKTNLQKQPQQVLLADDISYDDDTGKDITCLTGEMMENEAFVESEGHVSTLGSQNIQSDSVVSFVASLETHLDGEKENSKCKNSSMYSDDKSAFSSVCPAGRISFKLYDWNPAEFPRRLRHQIFQWLASMPVELEGYIRPGCTILTAFIAMPEFFWVKLLEDPAPHIQGLVSSRGSMLSGRGTMNVYLNNLIFHVTKEGTSVVQVKVKEHAPKLHYIYPTYFEAGKPMEFVACGANLLQPKFRFLISFAGQYLPYDISVSSIGHNNEGNTDSFDHQVLKIYVPLADVALFGPAFIEVENQSGLSNFIPILVGDKEVCREMEALQQSLVKQPQVEGLVSTGEVSASCVQKELSEFVLEVGWLLKEPLSDRQLTRTQIQRFNYLLVFLIKKNSAVILAKLLHNLERLMDKILVGGIGASDVMLLRGNMDNARHKLHQRLQGNPVRRDGYLFGQVTRDDKPSTTPTTILSTSKKLKDKLDGRMILNSIDGSAIVPLLNGEVVMNVNLKEKPGKSCSRVFTRTLLTSRPLVFAVAAIGVCFGICAVILHPQRVGELATTIRRCLFDNS